MVVKRVGSKNVDLNRSVLLEMKQVNYVGAEASETGSRIRYSEVSIRTLVQDASLPQHVSHQE